jgi:enoyl-[acyl-carrier protein] reductase/trans-2-enoyl-CoA reductase (NAD+)
LFNEDFAMSMLIEPKIRGFICTTAHPTGCALNVRQQIDTIKEHGKIDGPKKVLVIGASTGYGLASRIAAAFGSGAATIGVFFEKSAAGKRTASAGWYNTAAFEEAAQQENLYAKSINGDAFSSEIKQQTLDLIRSDWGGGVDCVIYSLASPRRVDAKTGAVYNSTLKPLSKPYTNHTVNTMTGEVFDITLEPANDEEILHTEKVMGGEDWADWIQALSQAGLLAPGVQTLAYSYIGPELTFPIYRDGTIGAAKKHLYKTVSVIDELLKPIQGKALISVNKALVTQASSAIPVVPLYISILYRVMKNKKIHEGCIEQIARLFKEKLYGKEGLQTDSQGFIRLDDWEMRDDIQAEVSKLWSEVNTSNLSSLTDIEGYRHEFQKLFGFDLAGVNYALEVDPVVPISSIPELNYIV